MPSSVKFVEQTFESALRKLAGEKHFERGAAYFRSGAVLGVQGGPDGLTGRVEGTELYLTRIWTVRGKTRWGCSCPLGQEGAFCKHLVATGLYWLSDLSGKATGFEVELARVKNSLQAMHRDALAELALERAVVDEGFYAELLLAARAAADTGPGSQPAATKAGRSKVRRTIKK
jgi:uncharacterized Zn finger protein